MSKITCTRRIEFDAAHRVMEHYSKCRMLHGHRYAIEATFCSDALDDMGMVIDFGIIKELLGGWIDENWDHNTILNIKDKELGDQIAKITDQKIYYLNCNPTAEEMASYLFEKICPKLFADYKISCKKIKIFETPNCYASVK
ncbi:MAG: 6-pyruvoyltetrahydropterin/6-carboxytetrahydropterin synthase [Rickettsiales bacterium]|jgi:6-pyruvoyltetrahydropterin/6-carboxytetrahydropterin synthase